MGFVISEQQVPVIDMAVLELEDQPASKEMSEHMARACETWGFFQLINHGLDASLLEKVKEESIGFFKRPEEEKLEYKIRPGVIEGFNSRSLTDVGSNKLTESVDHLFYVTWPPSRQNLGRWPKNPPAYRETVKNYTGQVGSLVEKLVGILSEELGLERGVLQDRLIGGPAGEPVLSMRTNYYTPVAAEGDANEFDKLCLLQAHSDPGGLTVLLQNDVAGLEVKKDGSWVGVKPIANALVVNIGDQIEILSNGRYKSVEHRGNAHRTKERLSIATFLGPDIKVVIGPMKELVDHAHPALYKTTRIQEYFANFVARGLNGKDYVRSVGVGAETSQ